MFRLLTRFCLMTIAAAIAYPAVGQCEDTLKLAVGAPNNWDSGVPDIGRRAGIFQKHGLNLELLYTSGGGETVKAVTLTQAMSGQVDVGWASPPFGLDALDEGKVRLIARGSDAPSTHGQTVRVHIVNANALAQRRDVIERFVAAYSEAYEWLYDNPDGVRIYADYGKVSERLAIRIRDEFLPKEAMSPERILGIDATMRDAIDFKFLQAPLSKAQLAELIQIPPRAK